MTQVELSLRCEGLEKLKLVADHLRQGAAHIDAAHDLLVGLRESGELAIVGDILGRETELGSTTTAVVG